jgi:ankyrin repeat protein
MEPRKQRITTLAQHRTPQLTKLLHAAATCRLPNLRRYLQAGGLPNTIVSLVELGRNYEAPLLYAAILNHHAGGAGSIELLLKAGANIDVVAAEDNISITPLMLACELSCCSAPLIQLLQHGAPVCQQNACGQTALHTAASFGHSDKCELLLYASSAELLELRDSAGKTALATAAETGHLPVVQLLHC